MALDLARDVCRQGESDVWLVGPLAILGQVVDRRVEDLCGVVGFAEQGQLGVLQLNTELASNTQLRIISTSTCLKWQIGACLEVTMRLKRGSNSI